MFIAACSFVPPSFGPCLSIIAGDSLPGSSGGLPGPDFHRLVGSPCLEEIEVPPLLVSRVVDRATSLCTLSAGEAAAALKAEIQVEAGPLGV